MGLGFGVEAAELGEPIQLLIVAQVRVNKVGDRDGVRAKVRVRVRTRVRVRVSVKVGLGLGLELKSGL